METGGNEHQAGRQVKTWNKRCVLHMLYSPYSFCLLYGFPPKISEYVSVWQLCNSSMVAFLVRTLWGQNEYCEIINWLTQNMLLWFESLWWPQNLLLWKSKRTQGNRALVSPAQPSNKINLMTLKDGTCSLQMTSSRWWSNKVILAW